MRLVVDVQVRAVALADKEVLAQLLELYLHDLSPLTAADVGPRGWFGYRYLDNYWSDHDRHPFFLRVGDRLAGLALVRSGPPHDMAEFFVMRKYRHQGIGRRAANTVFGMFPGEWQVRQLAANTAATAFWRSAIPVPFVEGTVAIGPVQRFRIDPA